MNLWRFINPIVAGIARSPIHFLISHQILVIEFDGRKSGKKYLVPLSYHKQGKNFTCVTLRSNLWWKNLIPLEQTYIWMKGRHTSVGVALEYSDDVLVAAELRHLVSGNAIDAFFAKVI
ncbi:MAG: hypothetical protein O3C66_06230, partial [Proteobacteria bacterium]|nr:hypothetical protein [Pseudomonadota bacterium]